MIRDALAQKEDGRAGAHRALPAARRPSIEPFENGMLLTTLRYDSTVRQVDEVLERGKKVELDDEMVALATKVIGLRKGKFDPDKFEDRYENAPCSTLIKSKKAGRKALKARPSRNQS